MPGQGAQLKQESVLLKGAQPLQSPPGILSVPSRGSYTACRSGASFSNPQLLPCTASSLHGAAPPSPQLTLLRAERCFLGWYLVFSVLFSSLPAFPLGFVCTCSSGFGAVGRVSRACGSVGGTVFRVGSAQLWESPQQSHRAVCKTAEKQQLCWAPKAPRELSVDPAWCKKQSKAARSPQACSSP